MTTADIVAFFMRRRKLPFREAERLADSVVIRRVLKADTPLGQDKQQLRIPFAELKRP